MIFSTFCAYLKTLGQSFKRELRFYRMVLHDRRTPRRSTILLWLAIGYALSQIDLIPDFIPIIGHLDDLVIVPALVHMAIKAVPDAVIRDCRARANEFEK